ncbi:hypothetical protein IFO70_33555 [Phormidium tenue FACHB-886]|nr:hypothetical protein [Phormidium tenue FACHB-886]
MDEKMIIVTIDEQYIDRIQSITAQLQEKGMHVDASLPMVGVVSGLVNVDRMDNLYQVEGVARVEIQQEYTGI